MQGDSRQKNRKVAVVLVVVVAGMVGLSFASVPLYQLFCQVTGFGGTTQVAQEVPDSVSERIITVRFNGDVDKSLPWSFKPEKNEVNVHLGEKKEAFYLARNLAARTTKGTSVFNVTPAKAGQYFNKIQCFCFAEQTLEPGAHERMGVTFFVDPALYEDPNTKDVTTITLSYTFYPKLEDAYTSQGKKTSEGENHTHDDGHTHTEDTAQVSVPKLDNTKAGNSNKDQNE